MKNLIQTAVVTLFAASAAHAQQAVQWKVSDGGNGHWYLLDSSLQSWSVASTSAALRGGHLATITTPQEQTFVRSDVYRVTGFSDTWLGAERTDCASPFTWVTGESFNGAPSGTGFDSDCLGWAGPGTGNFVEHVIRTGTIFGWETESDDANVGNYSLVEWSADCNNDNIVDYGQCRDGSLPDYNGNNVPDCCEAGESCVTNMLRNGSFEIGPTQGCGWICLTTGDDRLVGWDVTLNSVDRERTEPGGCNENWFASHGNYSIDMNGCSVGGIIRQFVPTEVGARYELSFDLSLNPANVAVGRLRASAGDASVIFEYARRSENPQPNEHHRMEFTATSQMTEVTFESLNREYSAQWNGPVVDSARMIPAVPTAPTCVDADIYRDFNVNGADLGILLSQWGPNTPLTESDLNKDGFVNGADLGIMLSFWGACP